MVRKPSESRRGAFARGYPGLLTACSLRSCAETSRTLDIVALRARSSATPATQPPPLADAILRLRTTAAYSMTTPHARRTWTILCLHPTGVDVHAASYVGVHDLVFCISDCHSHMGNYEPHDCGDAGEIQSSQRGRGPTSKTEEG